jgi:hypothetical protein
MFGFGEKTKLKKIRDDVRGISLREVIEKHADENLTALPLLEYDDALVEIFNKNVSDEDKSDAESLSAKLNKITTEHNLDERAVDMYMAHVGCDALKIIGSSLLIYAAMADDTDDVVEHFFDVLLPTFPVENVVPLLFPAKRGGRIEDFGIDSKIRYAIIDELFSRIKDTSVFVSLINHYVEINPYFRRYPL